jgi:predicted MPP superfamily phosphohydrolase
MRALLLAEAGIELKIDTAFSSASQDACKILLAHNPDTVDTDFSTKVSLVISGHTHGGQVVLPFWGAPVLPVRFNCYPEIAVLELVRPGMSG